MYYHVLHLICDNTEKDVIIAFLTHLPFESFEYVKNGINAYIKSEFYNQDFVLECQVAVKNLNCRLWWHELKEENWNKVWEANFQPIEVDDFIRIRAPFHVSKKGFEHEIIINPKMAFGTGHHETTYMVIQAMRTLDFKNKRILDFGSGTGLLSIIASKMGALEIDAVDNDKNSIRNTVENCYLNQTENINPLPSTDVIIDYLTYDIVLANINKNVLKQFARRLYEIIIPSGILVLSGILESDFLEIKNQYIDSGFTLNNKWQKGEWLCLIFSE